MLSLGIMKEENEIVKRCIQKDEKALKEFYYLYAQKLFAICLRYIGDSDTAKDILQESFLKIFDNLKQFSGNGPIEAWMSRITANSCIAYLKKQKKFQAEISQQLTPEENNWDNDSDIEEKYSPEILYQALSKLDENFKTVFNLFVFEDYSHGEIAQLLGINENTSRSRLSRARIFLKKELEKTKNTN